MFQYFIKPEKIDRFAKQWHKSRFRYKYCETTKRFYRQKRNKKIFIDLKEGYIYSEEFCVLSKDFRKTVDVVETDIIKLVNWDMVDKYRKGEA